MSRGPGPAPRARASRPASRASVSSSVEWGASRAEEFACVALRTAGGAGQDEGGEPLTPGPSAWTETSRAEVAGPTAADGGSRSRPLCLDGRAQLRGSPRGRRPPPLVGPAQHPPTSLRSDSSTAHNSPGGENTRHLEPERDQKPRESHTCALRSHKAPAHPSRRGHRAVRCWSLGLQSGVRVSGVSAPP